MKLLPSWSHRGGRAMAIGMCMKPCLHVGLVWQACLAGLFGGCVWRACFAGLFGWLTLILGRMKRIIVNETLALLVSQERPGDGYWNVYETLPTHWAGWASLSWLGWL